MSSPSLVFTHAALYAQEHDDDGGGDVPPITAKSSTHDNNDIPVGMLWRLV